MKLIRRGRVAYDHTNNALSGAAGAIILLMMLGISTDVLSRFFFNFPITGTVEVSAWAILCIPFLGAAWLLRSEGHVKMDLLINRLSPQTRAFLNTITFTLGAIICFVFTWYTAENCWHDYITGYFRLTVLSLPRAPFDGIMALGFFLLAIQFVRMSYGYSIEFKLLRSKK